MRALLPSVAAVLDGAANRLAAEASPARMGADRRLLRAESVDVLRAIAAELRGDA